VLPLASNSFSTALFSVLSAVPTIVFVNKLGDSAVVLRLRV
jgi:hypothetical protein